MPLDASLTEECPHLTVLTDGSAGAVLRKLIEVSDLYYDCALSKKKLIEATR
jgi:hypothetical protein